MISKHFHDLNFSLANEDSKVEQDLLPDNCPNVLVVPSSGAQALPLLAKNPGIMDIVDTSRPQLFLTELRIQAAKKLSYEDWLYFMGYRRFAPLAHREMLFNSLELSQECRLYWRSSLHLWSVHGFIWLGRWERSFLKMGKAARGLLFTSFRRFFSTRDMDEQRKIYLKHWPRRRFKLFLKVATGREFMNRVLYRSAYSGAATRGQVKYGLSPDSASLIEKRYEAIFMNQPVRKNFFLQMLFLGKIEHEEALPAEAQRDIFEKAKTATTHINYINDSVTHVITKRPYDFYYFSDVLSYLDPHESSTIMDRIHPDVPSSSLFVSRLYMKGPKTLFSHKWQQDSALEQWAQDTDQTGNYDFRIARKI